MNEIPRQIWKKELVGLLSIKKKFIVEDVEIRPVVGITTILFAIIIVIYYIFIMLPYKILIKKNK